MRRTKRSDGDTPPTDPEQGRPIGKWGYCYYIALGLAYLLASLLVLTGVWR